MASTIEMDLDAGEATDRLASSRTSIPDQHGFGAHDTELRIDAGDGTVLQVVVSHGGGLPQEVVDRIIESVRLLP